MEQLALADAKTQEWLADKTIVKKIIVRRKNGKLCGEVNFSLPQIDADAEESTNQQNKSAEICVNNGGTITETHTPDSCDRNPNRSDRR
jgi:hypothetical protein